jgi:hypothetical protein
MVLIAMKPRFPRHGHPSSFRGKGQRLSQEVGRVVIGSDEKNQERRNGNLRERRKDDMIDS